MSEQSGEFLFTDNLEQLRQSMHQNLQGIVGDLRETGSQLDGTDIGAGFVDNLVRDIATKGSQAVQTAREVAERIKEALASGTALPTGGFAGAFKAEAPQLGKQMEDYFRLQVADLPDTVRANPKVQQILGDAYEHVARTVASGITAERQGVGEAARGTPGVAPRDAVGRGQNPAQEIERALGGFAAELRSTLSPFGQDVTRFQAEGREVAERIRAAAQGGGARLSAGDNAAVRAGAAGQGPLAGSVQPNAERSSFAVDLGGAQAAITGDFVEGFTRSGPIVHDILRSAVGEAGPVLSTSIKDALAEGARIIAALGSGEAVRIGGKASPNVAFPAEGTVAKLNSAGENVPLNANQEALLQQSYAEQVTAEKAKQQAAEVKRTSELNASIDRAVRNEQAANEADVTSTRLNIQHADLLNRRNRAETDVQSGAGVTAGKVTFSSQGATETGTGRIVNDFSTLRGASQALSVKLEQLAEAEVHASKTPIDGLIQGLFGAGGRKRTGGAQPVNTDSPLFGLAETAGVVAKYEVLGRGIASMGGAAVGAVRDFAGLDEATRQLNEVFGTSESTSGQLIGKLQDVAASAGIATVELVKAATAAGAAFGGDTGTGRAQAAEQSAPAIRDNTIVTTQDAATSGQQLIAIGTAYGLAADQISRVNDAVANARNEFGGNAGEIQKGLAGLAVVGPQAGYSLDQLALSVSKVQAATGEGGSQIAASFTRIFSVLEKPASRTELADKLGIKLTGDARNSIEQLAQAYPALDTSQRVFLETTAGGARALRSLVPLLADQPGLQAAFARGLDTSGIGAAAADTALQGLGGQLRAFGSGVKELAVNIAQSGILDPFILLFEVLKPGLDLLNGIVKGFNDISPAVRGTALSVGELIVAVNALKLLGGTNLGASLIGSLPTETQLARGAANVRTGGLAQQVGGIFRGERARDDVGLRTGERQAGGGLFGNPFIRPSPEVNATAGLKAANDRFITVIDEGTAKRAAAELTAANAVAAGGAGSEAAVLAQANAARVTTEAAAANQAAARAVATAQATLTTATDKAALTQETNTLAVAESTGASKARIAADGERAAVDQAGASASAEKAAADGAGALTSRARSVVDGTGAVAGTAHNEALVADTASFLANADAVTASTFSQGLSKVGGATEGLFARGLRGPALNEAGAVVGRAGLLARLGIGAEGVSLSGAGGIAAVGGGLAAGAIGAAGYGAYRTIASAVTTSRRGQDLDTAVAAATGSQLNADALTKSADAVDAASRKLTESSSGFFGSLGALTQGVAAQAEAAHNVSQQMREAAREIADASQKGATAGQAGSIDFSEVGSVSTFLKSLKQNGGTASDALQALSDKMRQLSTNSLDASKNVLLPGAVAIAASKSATATLAGLPLDLASAAAGNDGPQAVAGAQDATQGGRAPHARFGGSGPSSSGHPAGVPRNTGKPLDLAQLQKDLDESYAKILHNDGLDDGTPITTEKRDKAIEDGKKALRDAYTKQGKSFDALGPEVQAKLLEGVKNGIIIGLGQATTGANTVLTPDNVNDFLAALPGLAQESGKKQGIEAGLGFNGTKSQGVAGAQATLDSLTQGRSDAASLKNVDPAKLRATDEAITAATLALFEAKRTDIAALATSAKARDVSQFDKLGALQFDAKKLADQLDPQSASFETDPTKQAAVAGQQKLNDNQQADQLVTNAASAARAKLDTRDVEGVATRDVADAKAKLKEVTDRGGKGSDLTDAQKAYNESLIKLGQASVTEANILRDSKVAVGDAVGLAFAQAQDAVDTANQLRAGSPEQAAAKKDAAVKQVDANQRKAAQDAAVAQSKLDPRDVSGQAAQKLQDDIAARNALATGDTTGRANATRLIAQDQNTINQQNVERANAQREAAIDPRDTVGQARAAAQGANDLLAAALPTQKDYADKVKAARAAQVALALAISASANAYEEAGIDPRDTLGEAQAKVDAAQRAVNDAAGVGPAAATAAKALVDANIAKAQAQIDLANATASAADFPGDALQSAATAVATATANLANDKAGTLKYFQDLATLRSAQVAYARQIEDQQNVLEQLNSDQTNPVITAQNAVDAARRKLADDQRLGAPPETIQRDTLALNNAQNNEQKTAFQQQLSDAQTNLQLHRISGAAYLQYLQTLRTNVLATGLKTRQQVDELNQVDQAILAANQQLSGQFNLGDIKVPTVYQERRQAASGGIDITGIGGVVTTNPLTQKANDVIAPLSAAIAGIKTDQAITALAGLQGRIDQFATGIGLIAGPTAQDPGAFAGSGAGNLGSPGGISTINHVTINGVDIARVVEYLNGALGRGAVNRNPVLSGRKI